MGNKTFATAGGRRLWGAGSAASAWARRLDEAADLAMAPLVRPAEARQALATAWRAGRAEWFAPLRAPRLTR